MLQQHLRCQQRQHGRREFGARQRDNRGERKKHVCLVIRGEVLLSARSATRSLPAVSWAEIELANLPSASRSVQQLTCRQLRSATLAHLSHSVHKQESQLVAWRHPLDQVSIPCVSDTS